MGVPVSTCQSGQVTVAAHPSTEDVCRAVPSDRRSIPSKSGTRDLSRKGESKKAAVSLQCQTSPVIHDSASHGLDERSLCLEEELRCSRREWNQLVERQFQLEEELRTLRKEHEHRGQELRFLKEDRTGELGQQLGCLREHVDAKEERLSKLEAMLDGCDFAALVARASEHAGFSVRELINAIERRSSIGTPSAQKHQMHQQLDQQHLMPTHQQQCQLDKSQELQQQQLQRQNSSRPQLRYAAGGS